MSDITLVDYDAQTSCSSCNSCTKIKGCAAGVPYLQIIETNETSPANVTFINLLTGAVTTVAPVGYTTGECPAYQEVDLVQTEWQPICVSGVQWFTATQKVFNNSTGLVVSTTPIYKLGPTGTETLTAPVGTIVNGSCTTQRIHENFVVTGTTPLVIPAGLISISVTKTSTAGIVNISGSTAVNFPLTAINENFTDSVNEAVSTLSAYTITGTTATTTYKVHIIR